MTSPVPYASASRPVRPEVLTVLQSLKPGDRIQIRQIVRVGLKSWPVEIVGTFRHIDSLATGLATDRVPQDDIIVPIIHFTKDNKELSSVAVDEHTRVQRVTSGE